MLAFVQVGAGRGVVVVGGVSPGDLGGSTADDLEAIREGCPGCNCVGAEAGARIIDLDDRYVAAGVVDDGGGDVWRLAAGEREESRGRK